MKKCAKCGCENANHKIPKSETEFYYLCDECYEGYKEFYNTISPVVDRFSDELKEATKAFGGLEVKLSVQVSPKKLMGVDFSTSSNDQTAHQTFVNELKERYNKGLKMVESTKGVKLNNFSQTVMPVLKQQIQLMKETIDKLEKDNLKGVDLSIYTIDLLRRLLSENTENENYENCAILQKHINERECKKRA